MKKSIMIFAVISALCLLGLVAGGPCGQQVSTDDNARASTAEPDLTILNVPDPEGTVRFVMAYMNNINGEFEPCG